MRRFFHRALAVVLTALLVLAELAFLGVALTGDRSEAAREQPGCPPLQVTGVRPDRALTGRFEAYGDDNERLDDWTGGDGTWSARLPGGRTLWIFADTFLGRVQPPDAVHRRPWRTPLTQPGTSTRLIRNSAVVQLPEGRLTTTIRGSQYDGQPRSWIADPGANRRYEPAAAVVEPESPGSRRQVLRLFAFLKDDEDRVNGAWGTTIRSLVLTFALDDLTQPRSIEPLPTTGGPRAGQVFYGYDALVKDGFTYVYGGAGDARRAGLAGYTARVPSGALGEPGAWRYWDGAGWNPDTTEAAPTLPLAPGRSGAAHGFTVARQGETYVLFTMDTSGLFGLDRIVTYWGCHPLGPWHGPSPAYRPPQAVRGGATGSIVAYNPHVHRSAGGPGLLLSHDLNDADLVTGGESVHLDVSRYRPRFLRLTLGPA
ncbi:MAG: hypothetical protein GEV11_21320 [Streptosporangiales bacterium]|nr:hypothetical protein [Streptosporangiales bacterium]